MGCWSNFAIMRMVSVEPHKSGGQAAARLGCASCNSEKIVPKFGAVVFSGCKWISWGVHVAHSCDTASVTFDLFISEIDLCYSGLERG